MRGTIRGLLKLQVVGSIGDFTIGGAPATIVAGFLVKVDLTGHD